ncbi:sporulation protein [Bacillus sp. MUM 116]|uniref:DUF1360 domain-containing protein n=1 Tax=Bacillus sp. MUM 116 TaxID=1678002 RepID=UPI0008F591CA|nr:DUF1360 domain-containing protein [Bacillus sp. MUM 116]OIK11169.1 sporulation protein [Bacillus sp. MUM 116]
MEINLLQFIILGLAAFRLTRLLVFDKITEFLRNPFFTEVIEENDQGEIEVYYVPKETPIKRFFGELLSCYWCTGIWSSTALVLLNYFYPDISAPIVMILAIAGFASILETIVQNWLQK